MMRSFFLADMMASSYTTQIRPMPLTPINMSCHRCLLFCVSLFAVLFFHEPCGAEVSSPAAAIAAATGGSPPSAYNFDRMKKLARRLDALEASGPDILKGFYDPKMKSFSIKPGGYCDGERMCITSTCYALLTLSLGGADACYSKIATYDDNEQDDISSADFDKIPINHVLRELLASNCRSDDLFQIPLLLYTLLRVDTNRSVIRSAATRSEYTAAKLKKLIATVLAARPHRSSGAAQVHSDYVIYQICKVLALLQTDTDAAHPFSLHELDGQEMSGTETAAKGDSDEMDGDQAEEIDGVENDVKDFTVANDAEAKLFGLPKQALPDNVASNVFWALLRCNEVSYNELCRQLAYRTAGDSNLFDVIRLAYSLLTYIRSTESLHGVAGKETEKGKGPSPDTRVNPLNQRLVTAALAAFFQEQNSNGLWDKGQPIYKTFAGGKGRSMEAAFVFPVNTVGSLLCALPAESFRPHLAGLERTLSWIEDHESIETITTYCDDNGNCYGRPLRGWSSSHLGPGGGPQAWPTAQVLKCASWMKKTIQELMHNDVLEEFNGVAYSKNGAQMDSWDRLLDTDLGDSTKEGGCRSIKSVLEERVVHPFSKSIDNPSYGACYSAILFGPPGTAKTSTCEALAQRLGYDFVCIDTAAFLADGLSNVASRIRYVFSRLMALKHTIILFDEIEEFALDRENKDLSMESRMLTTSMLTAINDLRRNKKSIFFIATNRLRAFDSAVIRPGRFDMQLFVGTPNLESKVLQFKQELLSLHHVLDEVKAGAIEVYEAFLREKWSKTVIFMNYLEGQRYAASIAEIVAAKNSLTREDMSPLLKKQASVMTVRGAARDEYIASMDLSRL